jgi:hypothetical protein
MLTTAGLAEDNKFFADFAGERLPIQSGDVVTWSLLTKTLPAYLLKVANDVVAELAAAFDQWGHTGGITFARVPSNGQITVSWSDLTSQND